MHASLSLPSPFPEKGVDEQHGRGAQLKLQPENIATSKYGSEKLTSLIDKDTVPLAEIEEGLKELFDSWCKGDKKKLPLPGGDKPIEEQEMEEALKAGKLLPGTPLYVKFIREHPKGSEKAKEYNADRRYDIKHQFQMDWVERTLAKKESRKTHERSCTKKEVERSNMLDFGMLAESYGIHYDKPRAIAIATRHASKCIRLGSAWCFYDETDEIMLYRKKDNVSTVEMSEAWGLFESQYELQDEPPDGKSKTEGDLGVNAPAAAEIGVVVEKRGGEVGSGTATENANAAANEPGKADEAKGNRPQTEAAKPKAKAEKTQTDAAIARGNLQRAITEASALKARYLSMIGLTPVLLGRIVKEKKFSWANNTENKGKLQSLLDEVKRRFEEDEFSELVITSSLATLKRPTGAATLQMKLADFSTLEKHLTPLEELYASTLSRSEVAAATPKAAAKKR